MRPPLAASTVTIQAPDHGVWIARLGPGGRVDARRSLAGGAEWSWDCPSAGTCTVVVGAEGRVARCVAVPIGAAAPPLELESGRELSGELRDAFGHALADQEVRVVVHIDAPPLIAVPLPGEPRGRTTAVDDAGSYLRDGALVLRARTDAYGRFAFHGVPWTTVDVEFDGPGGRVTASAPVGATIQLTAPADA